DVHRRHGTLDRLHHVEVEVAGELGMDPALQADLGGPLQRRLPGPGGDVLEAEQVRVAPEVERLRPLGEGAEAAAEVAHVRVVDVAVDDEGHRVPADLPAQVVGGPRQHFDLGAAGRQQGDDAVL